MKVMEEIKIKSNKFDFIKIKNYNAKQLRNKVKSKLPSKSIVSNLRYGSQDGA